MPIYAVKVTEIREVKYSTYRWVEAASEQEAKDKWDQGLADMYHETEDDTIEVLHEEVVWARPMTQQEQQEHKLVELKGFVPDA